MSSTAPAHELLVIRADLLDMAAVGPVLHAAVGDGRMTLVERPPVDRRTDGACCGPHGSSDPAVLYLWDLMASGLSQPEASLIVFGDAPDLPSAPEHAAGWVRRSLLGRLPWLRGVA